MIKNNESLSMEEISTYLKKPKEGETDLMGFIKKFSHTNPEKALLLRDALAKLDFVKINPNHISKMIDLSPEDKEDLNKIFVNISLNEDETRKILETIKKFR
jgi:DNA-directed RNA polymerase subunit F